MFIFRRLAVAVVGTDGLRAERHHSQMVLIRLSTSIQNLLLFGLCYWQCSISLLPLNYSKRFGTLSCLNGITSASNTSAYCHQCFMQIYIRGGLLLCIWMMRGTRWSSIRYAFKIVIYCSENKKKNNYYLKISLRL